MLLNSLFARPFAIALARINLLSANHRRRAAVLSLTVAALISTVPASGQVTPQPRAAAPILSLASGTYSSTQTVSISDATPGAVIHYSTNGAYPGSTWPVYSAPISVSSSEIIVAVAIAPGYDNSPLAVGRYIISSSLTGWIYPVAGNGSPGYSGDGAQPHLPSSLTRRASRSTTRGRST